MSQEHASAWTSTQCPACTALLCPLRPCRSFTLCSGLILDHVCFTLSHTSYPFLWTQRLRLGDLSPAGISLCCVDILSHLKTTPPKAGHCCLYSLTKMLGHRVSEQTNEQMKLLSKWRLPFICRGLIRLPFSVFHKAGTQWLFVYWSAFLWERLQIDHCHLAQTYIACLWKSRTGVSKAS